MATLLTVREEMAAADSTPHDSGARQLLATYQDGRKWREIAVATVVTPEDVLGTSKSSPPMMRLWDASSRLAVGSLGSSVANHPQECSALKCATENYWLRRYGTAAVAILLVAVVCSVATRWVPHPAVEIGSVRPVDGLTIFAAFFVTALAIERLVEPLSNALLPKAQLTKNAHEAMKQARSTTVEYLDRAAEQSGADERNSDLKVEVPPREAATQAAAGVTKRAQRDDGNDRPPVTTASTAPSKSEADPAEANAAIQDAAAAVEALNVRQLQRATVFWAIATCLGMLVAAAMNLYFMNTVGITIGQRWEEILATGLIIGGGTKPLHDLVKLISSKSAGIS
jgi:hypothetical protein